MAFENINRILVKYKRPTYLTENITLTAISFLDGFIEGLNSAYDISDDDYFACLNEIFQAKRQLLKINIR